MISIKNSSVVLFLLVASLGTTACGNDTSGSSATDPQAFCDQAEALDKLERPPTDEELDRLVETAPDEIRDESEILTQSASEFRAGNEGAADSPEIQAAGERFDEFVEKNC